MRQKNVCSGYTVRLLAVSLLGFAGPALAQLPADDDTANVNCSLNYSDTDCWVGGLVPNNNGNEFDVTIDDPTPLIYDIDAAISGLMIDSGSSLGIGNGRTLTLWGDTGSGTRGDVMVEGLLSLNSGGSADSKLVLLDGTTTIGSSALPGAGTYNLTSSVNQRNIIEGAGTTPKMILNNMAIRYTGTLRNLDELEINDSRVDAIDQFNGFYTYDNLDRLSSNRSEYTYDGANSRGIFRDITDANGNLSSVITTRNGGTMEMEDSNFRRFGYDVRGTVTNRRTTVSESTINVGDGGVYAYDSIGNRVAANNIYTIGDNGEVRFNNASESILEAGLDFVLEAGGKVRTVSTGSITNQFIEGNGGDYVTYRSDSLNPDPAEFSYDSDGRRAITRGTGDTPRLQFINQRVLGSGDVLDLDEVRYDNSRVTARDRFNSAYVYDNLDRLNSSDTIFNADGANSRFVWRNTVDADGNLTTQLVTRNGGSMDMEDSNFRRFGYDVRGTVTNRRTTVSESTINVGDGGVYAYDSIGNRVAANNIYTIGDNGEVRFNNASESILEAGLDFVLEAGGKVRTVSTGSITNQFIEGNGGDYVTYRSDSLNPDPAEFSYDSDGRRAIARGTGDTPRLQFINQRVLGSGDVLDLDEVRYDNSRVTARDRFNSAYVYDNLDRLNSSDTIFNADGANSRLIWRLVPDANGNFSSQLNTRNGGTMEMEDSNFRRYEYDVRGTVTNRRTTVSESTINVGEDGVFAYDGIGNRLDRSNTVNVDGGELRFNINSETEIEDGTIINISNGGMIGMKGASASPATVLFGGITADAVVINSDIPLTPNQITIQSEASVVNVWQGQGPAADLDLRNQGVRFTGTWRDFDDVFLTDSTVENNENFFSNNNRFTFDSVSRVTTRNTKLTAKGPGGRLEFLNSWLDGGESTDIRAEGGATFYFEGGRAFDFDATLGTGSTIEFNGAIVSNASFTTEGSGLIRLSDTDVSGSDLAGNVQVGGDFLLDGDQNSYGQLSTDPNAATNIRLANGAEINNPIVFSSRGDNSLAGDGPIVVRSLLSGSASIDEGVDLLSGGEIRASSGNTILFNDTGSQNGGLISADGGSIIVNEDVSGSGGSWNVSGGGSLLIGTDKNISGAEVNIQNGTFNLQGGQTTVDSVLAEVDANIILASVLSTEKLSIAMTDENAWNPSITTIIEMRGGEGAAIGDWANWGMLEIAGEDLGFDPQGFIDNFSIPTLEIGAGANVLLQDLIDNGNRNGPEGAAEALYVDKLVFQDGFSVLNLNGLNIYFNEIVGNESQIINVLVPVPVPAAALLFGSALGLLGWIRRRGAVTRH